MTNFKKNAYRPVDNKRVSTGRLKCDFNGIMPNHDSPLYQAAIKAIREAYQEALKTKHCKNCGYLAEDWTAGTGKYFCSHPETDFVQFEFNLVANPAQDCDFFERDEIV